jgi:hypothetical protein
VPIEGLNAVAQQYTYPTASALTQIDRDFMDVITTADPIFKIFPMGGDRDWLVQWDRKDNYQGLTQIRGLNGKPPRVNRVGAQRFRALPGVYGEFTLIDEEEMTRRAAFASFNAPIDINDLVVDAEEQLVNRHMNRVRWICWNLLIYGTFNVLNQRGALAHTDSYVQRTYVAPVTWDTFATAAPLQDFRNVQLMARGYSLSFGSNSVAYGNQQTINWALANTNNADLYGRRTQGLGTYNSTEQVNQLLMGDNLPKLQAYDEGYYDINGTFQLLVPDGYLVVIGKRNNNAQLGEFTLTLNVNNPGHAPTPYARVFDSRDTEAPPRRIEVHRGFNGGPKLWYPSAIVVMKVK